MRKISNIFAREGFARRIVSTIGATLILSSLLAPVAQAADDKVGLSVSPPTFELAANPGDTLKNTIRVDNLTDDVLEVTIERQNFTAAGEEGQAELTEETTPFSLAAWIKVATPVIDIPAKASKTVPFTVNVPTNAEPGGHFGSVVFRTKAKPVTGQSGVAVGQQIGALLFLRVAGDLKEEGKLVSFNSNKSFFEYGPVSFESRLSNGGNVHFKPQSTITIANMLGQKVATIDVDPHNVLPGAIRKFSTEWKPKYLFGKYTATLSVVYGDKKQILTATTTFIGLPYKLVGVVLIASLIVLTFIIRRRKRFARVFKILFGRD